MKKNTFSKKSVLLNAVLILLSIIINGNSANAQKYDYEQSYYYVYVSATGQSNNTGYISQPLFYNSYEKCGATYEFSDEIKRKFAQYLHLTYPEVFPSSAISFISYINKDEGKWIKTNQQKTNALNNWLENERTADYKAVQVNFYYDCE